MAGRATTATLATALCCAALLGCPDGSSRAPAPTEAVLELDVAPGDRKSRGPLVGETIQLRLTWGAGSAPKLLNNLVLTGSDATATWSVEPAEAVKIDPRTSKATLVAQGEVEIRATFVHEGRPIRSNPLKLRVRDRAASLNKTAGAASTSK